MLETGFLAGLVAKLAALGAAAKVTVATTTAALTVTAAAAGGVLAVRSGDSGPDATQAAVVQSVDRAAAVVDSAPTSGESAVQAGGNTSVATDTGSTSATARAGAVVDSSAAPTASLTPSLPIPAPALPDLSGLTQLPTQVMGCLTPVFNLVSSLPAVSPQQISQVGPNIVGCVKGIVSGLPLPFGLNACISEVLAFVSGVTSQLPSGGVPDVGSFNVASCIPSGVPVPTGSSGGFPFSGGGFSFGR